MFPAFPLARSVCLRQNGQPTESHTNFLSIKMHVLGTWCKACKAEGQAFGSQTKAVPTKRRKASQHTTLPTTATSCPRCRSSLSSASSFWTAMPPKISYHHIQPCPRMMCSVSLRNSDLQFLQTRVSHSVGRQAVQEEAEMQQPPRFVPSSTTHLTSPFDVVWKQTARSMPASPLWMQLADHSVGCEAHRNACLLGLCPYLDPGA